MKERDGAGSDGKSVQITFERRLRFPVTRLFSLVSASGILVCPRIPGEDGLGLASSYGPNAGLKRAGQQ